jgi:hypothetical protein
MDHTDEQDPGVQAQAAVAGLARQVDSINRDVYTLKRGVEQAATKESVKSLRNTVTSMGGTIESLTELLDRLTKPGKPTKPVKSGGDAADSADGPIPMRSWLRLPEGDEAAVQTVLAELLPWMESVYLRYSTPAAVLPPCWLWHPVIVEELLWLMDAWSLAYDSDEACNKLVGDWHDRQRPGVTRRISEYAPGCNVLQHRDDAEQRAVTVPLATAADPFVTWWATNRDQTGPAPTPDQIKAGRRGGLATVPDTAGGQR